MKIECQLDYQTILRNLAQPVHLVVKLTADRLEQQRQQPLAFCVVLDRSGSMAGQPLEHARKGCELVLRNLRKEDYFSLVVFDDEAQVVVPLQQVQSKDAIIRVIRQIQDAGSTNLTAGWMLGRDELKKATLGIQRRLLLLTDGNLNEGITDPTQVGQIVASGLENDKVRTSCLGFGDSYSEDILRQLAKASGGDFHDADSPEKLPVIFKAELQGLQQITAQNVRMRVKTLDFCERWGQLSDYSSTRLPDNRVEFSIGDLVSEEDRIMVLLMEVLPLPLINGQPVASLEGEKLLELEILWDEIGEKEIKSCRHEQLIRVLGTQDAQDVKLNEETVAWVAVQRAGKAVDEATKDLDADKVNEAKSKLQQALDALKSYKLDEKAADGIRLLQDLLTRLESGEYSARDRKMSRYSSSYYRKGSTRKAWTSAAAAKPAFTTMSSVEEQLNEEPGVSSSGKNQPNSPPEPPPSKKP
jgi:Ca-activated chloride channel family protein